MAKKKSSRPDSRRMNMAQAIFAVIGLIIILAMVLSMVAPW